MGPPTIDAVAEHDRYRRALAMQPWLETFPLWLKGVRLGHRPTPSTWAFIDAAGRLGLPLAPMTVPAVYSLLASGEGRAMDVIGLWDGQSFTPWLARGVSARWEWIP